MNLYSMNFVFSVLVICAATKVFSVTERQFIAEVLRIDTLSISKDEKKLLYEDLLKEVSRDAKRALEQKYIMDDALRFSSLVSPRGHGACAQK